MNIQQITRMYSQFRQNPIQTLGGIGVPNNIMKDPQAIIQYMMNNGKVSQDLYNKAVQMANNLRGKI